MTAGHTPGPWKQHGFSVYDKKGRPVGQAASDFCADTIQDETYSAFCLRSGKSGPTAMANARLIASAPALLAALEGIADATALESLNQSLAEDTRNWLHRMNKSARAAIAAARGEK